MDRQVTSHKPGALALYSKAKIKKEPMQKIDKPRIQQSLIIPLLLVKKSIKQL